MTTPRSWAKTQPWIRVSTFAVSNIIHGLGGFGHRCAEEAPKRGFLAGMVRMKNEARFAPEWVLYHCMLGIEHVYIYDNNSDDSLGEVMAPLVAQGIVTIIPWSKTPASPGAHNHFLSEFGNDWQWVAFLDADEFIVEERPGLLRAALEKNPGWPAIGLNWRYFGGSGHMTVPDGLVIENFKLCDTERNPHVKVVAQPARVLRYRNSHNFYYRSSKLARTLSGRRIWGSFVSPGNESVEIRHFVYRSMQDYVRKSGQGFVDARGSLDGVRSGSKAELEATKHNETDRPMPIGIARDLELTLREYGYGGPYV